MGGRRLLGSGCLGRLARTLWVKQCLGVMTVDMRRLVNCLNGPTMMLLLKMLRLMLTLGLWTCVSIGRLGCSRSMPMVTDRPARLLTVRVTMLW